jgi:glutaredoxin
MPENSRFVCPNCGEDVPPKARACPHCGSDEDTGWSKSTYMDNIDLPLEDDEYEEILQKEFPSAQKKRGIPRMTWLAAIGIIVLTLFVLGMLRGVF